MISIETLPESYNQRVNWYLSKMRLTGHIELFRTRAEALARARLLNSDSPEVHFDIGWFPRGASKDSVSRTKPIVDYRGMRYYKDFLIERRYVTASGRPQPDEFGWSHIDYDGPEDKRSGFATSEKDAREQIDDILD